MIHVYNSNVLDEIRSYCWSLAALIFCMGLTTCAGHHQPTTRVKLEETVCTQCPRIGAEQDTLQFIDRVRRFVAKEADKGMVYHALCDTFSRIPMHQFPVDAYLRIFAADSGTSICGLSANLMVKILLENGIDAYTYNFGFDDGLSHVVVLVKHNGSLIIQDPHLNTAILTPDGTPMDLFRFLNEAAHYTPIFLLVNDTVTAELLVDPYQLSKAELSLMTMDSCQETWLIDEVVVTDSISKFTYLRCFQCEADRPCSSSVVRMQTRLRKETQLSFYYEAMLLKIHPINGAADATEVDARIDSLIASLKIDRKQ